MTSPSNNIYLDIGDNEILNLLPSTHLDILIGSLQILQDHGSPRHHGGDYQTHPQPHFCANITGERVSFPSEAETHFLSLCPVDSKAAWTSVAAPKPEGKFWPYQPPTRSTKRPCCRASISRLTGAFWPSLLGSLWAGYRPNFDTSYHRHPTNCTSLHSPQFTVQHSR